MDLEQKELSWEEFGELSLKDMSFEDKERLFKILIKKKVFEARKDFYTYVKLLAPFMLPEGFVDGKHIEYLCKELQNVFESVIDPKRQFGEKLMISIAPGSMKALDENVPILTLDGWKKHGDIKQGDYVFGPDGLPKRVLFESPKVVEEGFKLVFDDKSEIIAGAAHEWEVERNEVVKGKRAQYKDIVETRSLRFGERPDKIPTCKSIYFPKKEFLIDPYLLGVWLGDGCSKSAVIYSCETDIEHFKQFGVISRIREPDKIRTNKRFYHIRIPEMTTKLRVLELLNNKHIPNNYLQAPQEDRLALLQGLMDTDGHVDDKGSCNFTNKNKRIIDGVCQLIVSLGAKARVKKYFATLNGKKCGPYYQISFYLPDSLPSFRLTRKLQRVRNSTNPRTFKRYVKDIQPVGPRLVKCIQVEGGIYLAGRDLVPTHNSTLAIRLFTSWCFGRKPNFRCIAIGHSTTFAEQNYGRPVRNFMRTQEYREVFPEVEISKDAAGSGSWETTAGGTFLSAGAGTGIAGRRAHISFVDDVLSEQTAYSKTERKKVNDWYVPGLRSRLLPKSGEVIIGTRWMEDDLIGFLLETEEKSRIPWKYISIPALLSEEISKIFRKEEPEDSDKYLPGTSFWPEFWPSELLFEKRDNPSMTLTTWNALYMQNPTPEEGNIIKREQFKIWTKKDPPPLDFLLISMDTAFSTKETADYSVIQVWGVFLEYLQDKDGEMQRVPSIILIDNEKGRWDFSELCNKVREKEKEYKPDAYLIEKKASGQCYDEKTEVLTKGGWKFFKDIDISLDEFATRNRVTQEFEWQKASSEFHEYYQGDMYQFKGKTHDLLVTPNHRMLVNSLPRALGGNPYTRRKGSEIFLTAEELATLGGEKTFTPLTSEWTGDSIKNRVLEPDEFTPGSSGKKCSSITLSGDDYIKFMAMYLAEGWTQFNKTRTYSIHIGQYETSPSYEAFEEILKKMGKVQYRRGKEMYLTNRKLYEFVRQYGKKSDEKFIPQEIMNASKEQLQLFWDWYLKGDGHKTKKGSESITTTSKRMAGQLQEIAQKMGLSASIQTKHPSAGFIKIGNNRNLSDLSTFKTSYIVRLRKSKFQKLRGEKVSYRGNIYCVSVPNQTLYVRRNGYPAWCGNSLIQELRRWGFPVLEFMPDRDKISRTYAVQPFFYAGRIWVPEHYRWAEELVEEMCAFPYASHDDQHDCAVQTILWLRDSYQVGSAGYDIQDLEDKMKPRKSYWSNLIN